MDKNEHNEHNEMLQYWKYANDGCLNPALYTIVLLIVLLLSGCKTNTVVEYRDRYIDRYITKVEKDTFIQNVHDSVYFEVVQKGDTVFATKYKERLVYKDRVEIQRDTCWKDSIVTEYKEITKEVTKIPKLYRISLIFSILVIIFAFVKLYIWLKSHGYIRT